MAQGLDNRRFPEESRCNTARDGNVDSRECCTKTRPVESSKSRGPLSWLWRSVRSETGLDDFGDELLERGVQTSASFRSERYKLSDRNVVNFVIACLFRVVGDVCSEAIVSSVGGDAGGTGANFFSPQAGLACPASAAGLGLALSLKKSLGLRCHLKRAFRPTVLVTIASGHS